jgi:uncharacterized protein (DUF58 family)
VERFIDPRALARVRDLPLVARSVADGFLHGMQRSQQRGVGIEFSQYRAYEPGDALSRIDWKLYARSDRYYVREAERESEVAIWLVLDGSHSMAQSSDGGAWNKFDYARHLLATLAYLAQGQGDRVGLLTLSGAGSQLLPALSGEQQWYRILRALSERSTAGRFPSTAGLRAQLARLQGPGLVVVVSDFHEVDDEIQGFCSQLATSHNEVAALQLVCADELEFPWRGPVRFEDLESGEAVLVSARAAQPHYLAAREAQQAALRRQLGLLDVNLDTLNIDEALDWGLYAFLERRQRLPR